MKLGTLTTVTLSSATIHVISAVPLSVVSHE